MTSSPDPRPGEIRIINGQRMRFIERELEGDKWEPLGPSPQAQTPDLKAAVERMTLFATGLASGKLGALPALHPDNYRRFAADLCLILDARAPGSPIKGGREEIDPAARETAEREFVRQVARLIHSGDEGGNDFDDPDDAYHALDRLIARARDIIAMPLRQALGDALRERNSLDRPLHNNAGATTCPTCGTAHMVVEDCPTCAAQTGAADVGGELSAAAKEMVRLSEMGFEESMKEPEENGNFAAFERIKRAIAAAERLPMEERGALADIATERRRQLVAEGWTPEHDDEHDSGEMALAAASYAINAAEWEHGTSASTMRLMPPDVWPWAGHWWKPQSQRRDLVKAGALIVAEIDRLDRATQPPAPGGAS